MKAVLVLVEQLIALFRVDAGQLHVELNQASIIRSFVVQRIDGLSTNC